MLPFRYWTVYIKMLVAELKVQLFLLARSNTVPIYSKTKLQCYYCLLSALRWPWCFKLSIGIQQPFGTSRGRCVMLLFQPLLHRKKDITHRLWRGVCLFSCHCYNTCMLFPLYIINKYLCRVVTLLTFFPQLLFLLLQVI